MGNTFLSVANIINIILQATPSGLTVKNPNNLGLFTTETPNNSDVFRRYIAPSDVATDYGTDSVTYAMANAIFGQTPNILSGGGQLTIIPMVAAVSATSGKFVTANISANLATIITVGAGDIKVTVDGVVHNLLALNFLNCVTLADVAAVFQAAMLDCLVTGDATTLTFTSKTGGTASTVALAVATGGTGTALNGAGYLNSAAGAATPGANSSGESLIAAVNRVTGVAPFMGIISNLVVEDAVKKTTADAIQPLSNMWICPIASVNQIAGIGTQIQQAGDFKTRMVIYTSDLEDANLFAAAYAGRGFSVDFTGSNTSSTMNLKQLAGIDPDSGINQTLYDACNTAGVDAYVSYDGVPSVFSTGGNDFFDNPYSDIAFEFALQAAGFNFLRQTNTKVPQTEAGMNGLKGAYANVCQQFVTNGCLAPGSWTSSETFGDPTIFRNNVLSQGYYIYSQPITQQNSSDREDRIAPLVQIAAKRAGAIHKGDVIVTVND